MAFDVAIKAIDANDVKAGDILIHTNGADDFQKLDQTADVADPYDDLALSGMLYDRFDNKGYY